MAQWVTPCLPRFPDLDPHDVAHAETTTDDAILHSSIRSSGAQNVPPLTRDVEPESASAASSTMHSRDRLRRPVCAPSPLTSSGDEAVTGCGCSRENAVTTWSTTAPRARLTAMCRIIARGISRPEPCLSLDPFITLLPLRGSIVRYRLQLHYCCVLGTASLMLWRIRASHFGTVTWLKLYATTTTMQRSTPEDTAYIMAESLERLA